MAMINSDNDQIDRLILQIDVVGLIRKLMINLSDTSKLDALFRVRDGIMQLIEIVNAGQSRFNLSQEFVRFLVFFSFMIICEIVVKTMKILTTQMNTPMIINMNRLMN